MPEPTADPVDRRAESDKVCELDTISFIECTLEATVVPKLKLEKESDQVCDPILVSMPELLLIEYEGMEWSPAHIPQA